MVIVFALLPMFALHSNKALWSLHTAPPLEEIELTAGVITVDDSDYYTPDDPPTALSPLHSADKVSSVCFFSMA